MDTRLIEMMMMMNNELIFKKTPVVKKKKKMAMMMMMMKTQRSYKEITLVQDDLLEESETKTSLTKNCFWKQSKPKESTQKNTAKIINKVNLYALTCG